MPLNDATALAREHALRAALELHLGIDGELTLQPGVDKRATIAAVEDDIRSTAETFAAWLLGTTSIRLTRGPITKQQPPGLFAAPNPEGVPVQIHDDEKFTLTVHTQDAKGFETSDAIDWTADNTDVVTLQVSDDGRSCTVVAGNPGSAVITVTDTSTDPQLSATEAVDVVAGGTATITLTEGPVEKQ